MRGFLAFILLSFVCMALPLEAMPVQQVKSPKGISAWLIEDHSLPVVAFSFSWRGGLEQDPENKQGLSTLGAAMLTQGAGADDAQAFQKKLEDQAINLGFEAGRDALHGNIRSLKETLPAALSLLRAALLQPRFDADALVRTKAEMLSALKNNMSEPNWLLSRLMIREKFVDHPYARRAYGTEASIAAITVDDLKKWHSTLNRADLLVTVTGDITPQELQPMLDQAFADLPEKSEEAVPTAEATLHAQGQTMVLKHDGPQSDIMLVWQGLKRKDPDWATQEVMNYILGGGSFSSRLMEEIREKRGLTYGINSADMYLDHAALYFITASTPNEKAGQVLALTRQQVDRMKQEPVQSAELQAAKDFLIGSYALQLTSTEKVAVHYQELQRLGLSADEGERRAKAIKAVTPAQIMMLAKRIFAPGVETVFIVGQPVDVKADKVFDRID